MVDPRSLARAEQDDHTGRLAPIIPLHPPLASCPDPSASLPDLDPATDALIRQRIACLTARKREVLDLVVRGAQDKEIARDLGISYQTAKEHVSDLMLRLGVDSRMGLACVYHGKHPYGAIFLAEYAPYPPTALPAAQARGAR